MSDSTADARRRLLVFAYGGTVEQRRRTASRLADKYVGLLLHDNRIRELLQRLLGRVAELNAHMQQQMGLGRLCSACAGRTDGGCCSRYMAGETDSIQLLMNILAGVTVDAVNENESECCYLGPKGCIFPIKPMFCLNYNCRHILTGAGKADLTKLLELAGAVLRCQYDLEQQLIAQLLILSTDLP